jgi:hypothetical protein
VSDARVAQPLLEVRDKLAQLGGDRGVGRSDQPSSSIGPALT